MTFGATLVTDAVVLRLTAFGEADRVVVLYTRERGKVSVIAHAARKSRKRFGAALSYFVLGEASLRDKRGGELLLLQSFSALTDFSALAGDVVKMAHASYGTELVRELTVAGHADARVLDRLVLFFATLHKMPARSATLRAFELGLLDDIGLRPVLDRCVECGEREGEAMDGARLIPGKGGVACRPCVRRASPWAESGAEPGAGSVAVNRATRERLLYLIDAPLAAVAAGDPVEPALESSTRQVTQAIVKSHVQTPLKSLEFLQKLR